MDCIVKSIAIAASGLRAQAGRMRVIAENIANADLTASNAGSDPYRRKVATFHVGARPQSRCVVSSALGRHQATTKQPSRRSIMPGHPAADASGHVKYPNVNSLVEMTDMRDAQRSYEANINVIGATRRMLASAPFEILKA